MKQMITLLLLIGLCPMWAKAQSIEEIHRAMDAYDYEMPIARISPMAGDSLLTPLRAKALRAMNRYPEALKEWNSLLEADSTNTKVLIELAECYKLVGRTSEATSCYEKAVSMHPENIYFRQHHIRALLATENYEKARNACHAWLDKDSLSATAFKLMGMAYEGMVDNPDALTNAFMSYNAAYRIDSLDAQTVAHIASIFNNNEQFQDAVDVTEKYRLTDTLNIDVNRQNAKAYCFLKDYPSAIKRYEALKAMGDNSFTTLYYLGVSHYGDNWVYGAYDNLSVAHKKAPNDVNVLYYLGKAAARSSWKEEGVGYLKEAIEIVTPTDSLMAKLYDGLVECYRYSNKSDPYEKIEAMKKLYSYNKKYTLFYNIAYTYDHQKDYANAVHYYEKYMALVPKDKQVALDSDGKPMPHSDTLYQKARRRVEKIKAEDFFRNGVHDDYFESKWLKAVKQKADSLNRIK